MDQIVGRRTSEEEGRKLLADVIETERRKIEMLQLLESTDSLSPEDDRRHNLAMRDAWVFLQNYGVKADTAPLGYTLVARNVSMLAQDLASDARVRTHSQ